MRFFVRQTMVGNDLGRFLIRLIVGIVFMYHGSQKLFGAFGGPGIEGFTGMLEQMSFPVPEVNAWLAALAEFGGGVCMVLGLLMRLAVIPTIFTMLVACFIVHRSGFSAPNGMEYPLTLALVMFGLALMGPGRWSLDHLMFGRKRPQRGAETPPA